MPPFFFIFQRYDATYKNTIPKVHREVVVVVLIRSNSVILFPVFFFFFVLPFQLLPTSLSVCLLITKQKKKTTNYSTGSFQDFVALAWGGVFFFIDKECWISYDNDRVHNVKPCASEAGA